MIKGVSSGFFHGGDMVDCTLLVRSILAQSYKRSRESINSPEKESVGPDTVSEIQFHLAL